MKTYFYVLFITLFFVQYTYSQNVWINEFSYNCADSAELSDGDEFVEIVAPVGTDMSQYGLAFFEYTDGSEYMTYFYSELSGTISSVNSNNGKGFMIIKTNNSHRLEIYTPIEVGITRQTLNTEMYDNYQSGIILVNAITGDVIHSVVYEMPVYAELPVNILNKDNPWGSDYFDFTKASLDGVRLPLSDAADSSPNGSISMIGTGFARIWTTTNGEAPNISTPGALNYSQGALPVELSSFSASVSKNGIILNWRTETEVNNYGFDVERKSADSTWERIIFVNGNGNSNSPKEYSYIDKNVIPGKYLYRLKQLDNDGTYSYSDIVDVDFTSKIEYALTQNYPNPFNPTTTISFSLPSSGNVKLTIFNLIGQEIKTLYNGFSEAGVYTFNFDAKNLTSGIYLYKLEASGYTQTKKMTLLK